MKKILLLIIIIFGHISYTIAGNVVGDVDNDGKVDVKEAIHALQTSAGIISAISEINMQSDPAWKINDSTIYSNINYNVCIGKIGPAETKLDVNGYVNAQAHITTANTFFVRGDEDKYYAVSFYDKDWNNGPAEFQIIRSSVHIDKKWKGSMSLRIKWHATSYGHGSNFIEYDYINCKNDFVSDIQEYFYAPYLMLWLKGNTTYLYRSFNNRVAVSEILGTNNEQCVYDPIKGLVDENTEVSCNYQTDVKSSILKGRVIDKGLSVASQKFVVSDQGNVGIGKQQPNDKLEVDGNIKLSGSIKSETGNIITVNNGDICIGKCQ